MRGAVERSVSGIQWLLLFIATGHENAVYKVEALCTVQPWFGTKNVQGLD